MARRISSRSGISSEGFGEGMILIKSIAANADLTIDSGVVFTDEFEVYKLIGSDIIFNTNSVTASVRMGTGSPTVTYDAGTNYRVGSSSFSSAGYTSNPISNAAADPVNLWTYFYSPTNGSVNTGILNYINQVSSSNYFGPTFTWAYTVQNVATGFQVLTSAGTITSGTFNLYAMCPSGVKNV